MWRIWALCARLSKTSIENEQNKEFDDISSVCEECVMVCMDIHHEDRDEDITMYGDQGVSTKKYDEDMYGELTKMDSEEE